jgi:hypothetical protein
MLRRLIDWLRRQWVGSPLRHPPTPEKLAMDIDEFASLLQSGKPEDLNKIAQTLARSDKLKI